MKHNQTLGLYALASALDAAAALGCSGINASKSVSPLDFLFPGFLENCPPSPAIPITTNTVPFLAQAGHVPLQIHPYSTSPI
jgi:hypothetical protein